jgi:protein-disulfide isomerase
MFRSALLTGLLLLALPLGFGATPPAGRSAFDKPTFEAYLKHMLLVTPGVQMTVHDATPSPVAGLKQVDVTFTFQGNTEDRSYYVSNDGKWIIEASLHNVNQSPFQSDLDKIKTEGAPSMGPANAPVQMVIYSDFECPNCKQFDQEIRTNLPRTFPTQVQLYFKDSPLPTIHPWSKQAAIAGRCIARQNPAAFWDYHDWIYSQQEQITPENLAGKAVEFAKGKGLDDTQLAHCIESAATAPEVDAEIAQARALSINATPTIFINGRRMVGNIPWPNLEAVIKAELEQQKTASVPKKDEKCCEVSLPTLTK